MHITPSFKSSRSTSIAAPGRRYVGRHRKPCAQLAGSCARILLAGVLVFATVSQTYRPVEQQATAVHRDV